MVTPTLKHELTSILHLFELGLTKAKVRKTLGISITSFSNRLRQLEDFGYIKRKGKYEIIILPSSSNNPRVTKIQVHEKLNKRGHAHCFKIIFPSESNLKEKPLVKEFLNRKPRKGKKLRNKPKVLPFGSIQFKYKRNTIWINKESLTVYSNDSYYAADALHSKFSALKDVDTLASHFKHKFGFMGVYGIEVFREHYGLIFNKFAEWTLSREKKLNVKNKGNKTILWVDDSKEDDIGLKEFEGYDPLKINKADKYFEEQEETDWEVSPKFILKGMHKHNEAILMNAKHLNFHAENMRSHVGAVRELGYSVRELTNEVKKLQKENKKLRKNYETS